MDELEQLTKGVEAAKEAVEIQFQLMRAAVAGQVIAGLLHNHVADDSTIEEAVRITDRLMEKLNEK